MSMPKTNQFDDTNQNNHSELNNCISETINVDNSNTVLERISRLYAEQLMSDVSLVVGGTEYPSHRLILCATSDVFQVMLMKPEWTECGESRVVLQETPECASVFASFLKYFYTGQIAITDSKIIPLLALADKYNVKSLEDICISYMKSHIAHAATQNQLISWLQYAAATGHNEITRLCHNFVRWNLEMVAESSDFDNLELDMLINILQQSDLVIHDELRLYECISRWIQAQNARIVEEHTNTEEIEKNIQKIVYSVMSYIRFPMMTPRQLADLLLNPLTAKYKEFFVDRFAIGMSFHSNQLDRIQETITCLEEGKLLFQPRLYTSDCWSTLLTVENYHSLPCYHTSTFVFSSHSTLAEHGADRLCEWVVDLFPKGVWFRKYLLIVWQGTVEVPETVLRTVRLAITCKDPPEAIHLPGRGSIYPDMRVKVGILISGCQGGIEHVMTVKEKIHHFSVNDRVMNIDDLIPFDDLNPPAVASSGGSDAKVNRTERHFCANDASHTPSSEYHSHESYLVGPEHNELKLHIVISPLSDNFDLSNPIQIE